MYYSEPYLKDFHTRVKASAEAITKSYEIIFVDDGSPDNSLQTVMALKKKNDKKIKIIELSRNFGHHKAMMTGLSHAKGDYVFLIDSDLEEEPELLEIFWKEINEDTTLDVIYGVQKFRKGYFLEKTFGYLFYSLFNYFSDYKLTRNLVVARLMKKQYVKSLSQYNEEHPLFAGLCVLAGYNQKEYYITKGHKKQTSYSFRKKLSLVINSITSFSAKPLVSIFYLGLIILLISTLFIIRMLYQKIFLGASIGWTSIVISIWFFGGLVIFCLGILGIYLAKIYEQSKHRPYTVIKNFYK
jgi:putative glycosyltransferase